jgi:type II secretory ATPase GspE/PulE/Tfp pilus assembly ATPase PilB-like protein
VVSVETPGLEAFRAAVQQKPDALLVGDGDEDEVARQLLEGARRGPLTIGVFEAVDAAAAIERFMRLGVTPRGVASVLVGVVAQRLVRRLCERCRRLDEPHEEVFDRLRVSKGDLQTGVYRPGGCDACDYSGFRGRVGLFEVVEVDADVRRLISAEASEDDIRTAARLAGTASLADEGLTAVIAGITTAEEVVRNVQMMTVPRPLCRGCGQAVESDYVACPRCGTRLHTPCIYCGRAMQSGWRVCPYCERVPRGQ